MTARSRVGATVQLLCPRTEAAKQWVARHIHFEPHQQIADGIVIGARYIAQIVEGMQAADLKLDEDFEVVSG